MRRDPYMRRHFFGPVYENEFLIILKIGVASILKEMMVQAMTFEYLEGHVQALQGKKFH